MTQKVGRKVRLYGRVQGVFFRQWAVHQANELGVSGWVRNLSDGSVEAHVAGDEDKISQMVARLRQGPSGARVEDIAIDVTEPEEIDGFSVRT